MPLLTDGLYQVTQRRPLICAGFVVEDGRIKWCAPILRNSIYYWARIAKRVGD